MEAGVLAALEDEDLVVGQGWGKVRGASRRN